MNVRLIQPAAKGCRNRNRRELTEIRLVISFVPMVSSGFALGPQLTFVLCAAVQRFSRAYLMRAGPFITAQFAPNSVPEHLHLGVDRELLRVAVDDDLGLPQDRHSAAGARGSLARDLLPALWTRDKSHAVIVGQSTRRKPTLA